MAQWGDVDDDERRKQQREHKAEQQKIELNSTRCKYERLQVMGELRVSQ